MEGLEALLKQFGPSGSETKIAEEIVKQIKPYADEIEIDTLGNVIALKKGTRLGKMMLAAHMDQIGIMITHINDKGFMRFTHVGGLNPYAILYKSVIFENGTIGTICPEGKSDMKNLKLSNLYVDIGTGSKEETEKSVSIGDYAVLKSDISTFGTRVSSGALDDRIGCYVMIEVMKKLEKPEMDVYFVFTVQEETYTSGASTSAYKIDPDCSIVIDVTSTGDIPNANPMAVTLGKGAAIKVMDGGMICHPAVRRHLQDTAEKYSIDYQLEVLEYGATDGGEIHITKSGVPTGAVSIPSRYIHTPNEMVDMKDVQDAIELVTKAVQEYTI